MFIMILLILFVLFIGWLLIKMKLAADSRQEDEELEAERKEYERTHKTFGAYIHGLQYENESGKKVLDVILQAARKEAREVGSFYKETRKQDFEDEPWLEVSEFDGIVVPCSLEPVKYEGKPAVKVWLEDGEKKQGAGWIPADDADYVAYLLRTYDPSVNMIVEGGKTKKLDVTDSGDKVEIEENDYFPKVLIEYEKPEK